MISTDEITQVSGVTGTSRGHARSHLKRLVHLSGAARVREGINQHFDGDCAASDSGSDEDADHRQDNSSAHDDDVIMLDDPSPRASPSRQPHQQEESLQLPLRRDRSDSPIVAVEQQPPGSAMASISPAPSPFNRSALPSVTVSPAASLHRDEPPQQPQQPQPQPQPQQQLTEAELAQRRKNEALQKRWDAQRTLGAQSVRFQNKSAGDLVKFLLAQNRARSVAGGAKAMPMNWMDGGNDPGDDNDDDSGGGAGVQLGAGSVGASALHAVGAVVAAAATAAGKLAASAVPTYVPPPARTIVGPTQPDDPNAKWCLRDMLNNEAALCGEYAVFYHSCPAVQPVYLVNGCIAQLLFGFDGATSGLPRLELAPFLRSPANGGIPSVEQMLKVFPSFKGHDGAPEFGAVAISAVTSLVARDSEMTAINLFTQGYSANSWQYEKFLERSLEIAFGGLPRHYSPARAKGLVQRIIRLGNELGLSMLHFSGGRAAPSGMPGSMMQIFVHRTVVDRIAYAAVPFGHLDPPRHPIGKYLEGIIGPGGPIHGQARVICHPGKFLFLDRVQCFSYSADATFQKNRVQFTTRLCKMIEEAFCPTLEDKYAAAKHLFAAAGADHKMPEFLKGMSAYERFLNRQRADVAKRHADVAARREKFEAEKNDWRKHLV